MDQIVGCQSVHPQRVPRNYREVNLDLQISCCLLFEFHFFFLFFTRNDPGKSHHRPCYERDYDRSLQFLHMLQDRCSGKHVPHLDIFIMFNLKSLFSTHYNNDPRHRGAFVVLFWQAPSPFPLLEHCNLPSLDIDGSWCMDSPHPTHTFRRKQCYSLPA